MVGCYHDAGFAMKAGWCSMAMAMAARRAGGRAGVVEEKGGKNITALKGGEHIINEGIASKTGGKKVIPSGATGHLRRSIVPSTTSSQQVTNQRRPSQTKPQTMDGHGACTFQLTPRGAARRRRIDARISRMTMNNE